MGRPGDAWSGPWEEIDPSLFEIEVAPYESSWRWRVYYDGQWCCIVSSSDRAHSRDAALEAGHAWVADRIRRSNRAQAMAEEVEAQTIRVRYAP